MRWELTTLRRPVCAVVCGAALLVSGCGGDESPSSSAETAASAGNATVAAEPSTLQPTEQSWTPEALEDLLAPVALYPDILLGQVLVASTNPQEVLDAGNWLLQNKSLEGKTLDEAAKGVGFTPAMRALMQSRDLVDMMCSEMGWTTELGQAYVNDQLGLLEAVQRLRKQAQDAGNLASSEQMKVETVRQDGQEVITLAPPSREVVYVPQYNPVTVYQPAPVPTTTSVVQQGHSTGTLVTTGLLSFAAGLLLADILHDDDHWHHPHYYGRPMPYYPPYPYRPRYGGGFHPGHGYYRPPGYYYGFNNTTIININKQNDVYWKRYDNRKYAQRRDFPTSSPITIARQGKRPELSSLNARAAKGPSRTAPGIDNDWKGKSTYAGAKRDAPQPSATRDAKGAASQIGAPRAPKVQGSYAGAKRDGTAATRPATPSVQRPSVQRPSVQPPSVQPPRPQSKQVADRGRPSAAQTRPASRPVAAPNGPAPTQMRAPDRSAISGTSRGKADREASQRGKQSVARSSGGAAGGDGRRDGR